MNTGYIISSIQDTPLFAALANSKPLFILPRDNVAETVISPAMAAAEDVSIMMGFFSSGSFAEIAPGLAAYLVNSDKPLRLIVSPFISQADQEALKSGTLNAEVYATATMESLIPDEDQLANHTLHCLAWLIQCGRLQVRIALVKDALFHSKVWLLNQQSASVALHGSANMTEQGLRGNREQLSLARNWRGSESDEIIKELSFEFETLWAGGDQDCITLALPDAIAGRIVREFRGDKQPTEKEFSRLWRSAHALSDDPVEVGQLVQKETNRTFQIPDWLVFQSGDYQHQGRAIAAWREQQNRGILEMCTGAGKTLTALAGAKLLYDQTGPLLIVVAAPYKVLLDQWCSEIQQFGLRPINMSSAGGKAGRERELAMARRRLARNLSVSEAIVVSNDTLCTEEFQAKLMAFPGPKLLIADECHNLGASGFISSPPEFFDYRLGLSATPVRQYDDEGTDHLFSFFGDPCFTYSLEEAIGTCLTPYDYHVTFVELDSEEMGEWRELSSKISKLAWKISVGENDEYLASLLLKRRKILETASSKVSALRELIDDADPQSLKYTLIYTTDKDPQQLQSVNDLLSSKNVFFHQLTAEETAQPSKSKAILDRFQKGDLQVLTAKRVLDEGVNVPQIMRAYLLASTTVRRQWVQRRGRLLRTCKAIGKDAAVIHDIVALPPGSENKERATIDPDEKKIINAELDRVWEFARLSRNAAESGGPFEAVERMREIVGG